MSAIELLKTIENLVQVVNEKNRELEKLKAEYGLKIHEINRYLDALHGSISHKSANPSTTDGEISDEQLIQILKSRIKCPQCDAEVWNNEKKTDFILFPRQKLQVVHLGEAGQSEKIDQNDQESITGSTSQSSSQGSSQGSSHPSQTSQPSPGKPKKSAKKSCSFCHRAGHSRARCLQRLNNDNSLRK